LPISSPRPRRMGLLVSSVLQRQVRLHLRTPAQQRPGNQGVTAIPTDGGGGGGLALRIVRDRQALPLHPRVEHPQDEIEDPMIAQFTLWSPLGHREVRQDKCGELLFRKMVSDQVAHCRTIGCRIPKPAATVHAKNHRTLAGPAQHVSAGQRMPSRLAVRPCTVTWMMRLVLLWCIKRLPSRAARMWRMMPA